LKRLALTENQFSVIKNKVLGPEYTELEVLEASHFAEAIEM